VLEAMMGRILFFSNKITRLPSEARSFFVHAENKSRPKLQQCLASSRALSLFDYLSLFNNFVLKIAMLQYLKNPKD